MQHKHRIKSHSPTVLICPLEKTRQHISVFRIINDVWDPQVRGLGVVFFSATWGQCCQRLTATGQEAAGQALVATSNHKDDTDKNKIKLGGFFQLIMILLWYDNVSAPASPELLQPPAVLLLTFHPKTRG